MMKTLDRKAVRQFLLVLLGAVIAFLAIFVIVDLVENLEDFIDQDAPWAAPVLYYLYYAPFIVVLTLPVAMLLASLSTIGQMARDNELLAMKASGISPYRPIRALAAVALVITALAFVVGETVVPKANEKKQMVLNEYVNKRGAVSRNENINRALDLGEGRMLFVKRYNDQDRLAMHITLARSEGVEVVRLVQAERMRYQPDLDRWALEEVEERTWSDGEESFTTHARLIESLPALTPEELAKRRKEPEEMGFSELLDYVERGRARGRDVRRSMVDLHMKMALPFANFIIVLFGASLAAVRRRTGLAVGFTVSILICFVYYGVIRTGQAFGYNGDLSPALGAWAGNIIFGVLSLFFLRRARF
ncbi:MAG: LptF/LptG family permease [bacterium]